jgi:hypothetical protein
MIPADKLAQLDALIARFTAAGRTDLALQAADILDQAIASNAAEAAEMIATAAVQPADIDPMTRAHARVEGQPRKLRKGRTRCSATRRDGEPCQAPAIKGGAVCRVHGGSTRLAQIAAGLEVRQFAYVDAIEAWKQVGDFDSLCRMLAAGRELDAYEAKLAWLRELRRAAKASDAARMPSGAGARPSAG